MARKLVATAPNPDYWIMDRRELDAMRDLLFERGQVKNLYCEVDCPLCKITCTILIDATVVECCACEHVHKVAHR